MLNLGEPTVGADLLDAARAGDSAGKAGKILAAAVSGELLCDAVGYRFATGRVQLRDWTALLDTVGAMLWATGTFSVVAVLLNGLVLRWKAEQCSAFPLEDG